MTCRYLKENPELLHRPHLKNLILRSNADLDTLRLRWVDDLFSLLECTPSLHVFFMCSINSPDSLASKLTLGQGADLCLQLRDITILNVSESDRAETLKNLVFSRRDGFDDDDDPETGNLWRVFINFPAPVEHHCSNPQSCRCECRCPPKFSELQEVYPDPTMRRPRFPQPDRNNLPLS